MNLGPLSKFTTHLSQKEEAGSYDNIALISH